MSISLTAAEKTEIINQHLKNLEYSLYHAQLDLIEANAITSPDAELVSSINSRISATTAKITALNAEKDLLA